MHDRAGRGDALAATSKHRTLAQVEWSRQLSRDAHPYFIPQTTSESRAQFTSGAENPRRHMSCIDMERTSPKFVEPAADTRDYTPQLLEELHKHCGVDIGKAAPRGNVFGSKQHDSEAVVEVELHPGWGRGKNSFIGKAPRCPPTPANDDVHLATKQKAFVLSAYTPLPEQAPFGQALESRLERPKGGFIPRSPSRTVTPAPDRPPLDVVETVMRPALGTVKLAAKARYYLPDERQSDRYRKMFQTPPPAPLSSPDRPRFTPGYAVQRQGTDRSVSSLLALADADHKRAKKLVTQTFGLASRSPARSAVLYTPTPMSGPTPASMNDGASAASGTPMPRGARYSPL